jgi:hypothetical protein
VCEKSVDKTTHRTTPRRLDGDNLYTASHLPGEGFAKPVVARFAWAALMRRAFDVDVLACRRCSGRLRLIATVEDLEAIRAILAALAASREVAGRAPPGAPAQTPSPATALGA